MEVKIVFQGLKDSPQLTDIKQPVIDLSHIDKMTFALIEGGMQSGEPSVVILVEDKDGSVVLQTSLDKFLMAARGMIAGAETRWNWKLPKGHSSLVPVMDPVAKKALLEAIKKELEDE